jgi:hypothetical protein
MKILFALVLSCSLLAEDNKRIELFDGVGIDVPRDWVVSRGNDDGSILKVIGMEDDRGVHAGSASWYILNDHSYDGLLNWVTNGRASDYVVVEKMKCESYFKSPRIYQFSVAEEIDGLKDVYWPVSQVHVFKLDGVEGYIVANYVCDALVLAEYTYEFSLMSRFKKIESN